MGVLGNDIAAAVFDEREPAEEAWAILDDAGVPATVITDPGMLGAYSVSVMVDRDDLERAQDALAEFMKGR